MRAVLSPLDNALSVAKMSLQSTTTPRLSESLADSGENVAPAYIPTTPRNLCAPPDSIPCASPGVSSTRGKSCASSQSSILATPPTSVFSLFVLSAPEHIEGVVECFDRPRSSGRKEVTEDHFVQRLDDLGEHHRTGGLPLRRQCIALRLAPLPLPSCDPIADATSPLGESTSITYRRRSRFSRKLSRPVIVTNDQDDIRSPMTAAREETAVRRGILSPIQSLFPGLDLSVQDGQSFPVDADSGSKGLRRVDGCANLKSLWLEVGNAGPARQQGMSVISLGNPPETEPIRSATCCPSPMLETINSTEGDPLMMP